MFIGRTFVGRWEHKQGHARVHALRNNCLIISYTPEGSQPSNILEKNTSETLSINFKYDRKFEALFVSIARIND
jgi:hypothetical protein